MKVPPPDELDGPALRPYFLTGGRTRSTGRDLPLEAMVSAVDIEPSVRLEPEQVRILDACRSPRAIAELAVALGVPVGVARVLVSDLASEGLLQIHETMDRIDADLVRRLRAGVLAL